MQDLLFNPLEIGPKTSRNRLWRMPVSGSEVPTTGDWGAVFLGETFIVPGKKLAYPSLNLYDDAKYIADTVEGIKKSGALAGIEIAYNPEDNWDTELILRHYAWAACAIKSMGFDLITLYVAHGGGGFLRENTELAQGVIAVLLETMPGIAVGIRTDEIMDFWDLEDMVDYWDMVAPGDTFDEVFQPTPGGTKTFTKKPVVHAGFTQPDDMRHALFMGDCDIIGLARAAIADAFLPTKLLAGIGIEDCDHCQGCFELYQSGEPVVCTKRGSGLRGY